MKETKSKIIGAWPPISRDEMQNTCFPRVDYELEDKAQNADAYREYGKPESISIGFQDHGNHEQGTEDREKYHSKRNVQIIQPVSVSHDLRRDA